MKKTLLILTILLTFSIFSQERTNISLPRIQSSPTKILTKSTGYCLKDGLWVSKQNQIPAISETVDEIDNFVSYDLRDIVINDTMYSLFLKKYKTGWFKYPELYEGWSSTINAEYFVINKKDIDSLKIHNDSFNLIKLKPIYHGWVENAYYHKQWNNSTYILEIQKDIVKQIANKEKRDETLIFHIYLNKTKNIVRFQFYSSYSKYNIIGSISNEHKILKEKPLYSGDTRAIYGTNDLFKYCYYETDCSSFNNLIKL
jgi:hypothetical protein